LAVGDDGNGNITTLAIHDVQDLMRSRKSREEVEMVIRRIPEKQSGHYSDEWTEYISTVKNKIECHIRKADYPAFVVCTQMPVFCILILKQKIQKSKKLKIKK
jgi:hypothetical protein